MVTFAKTRAVVRIPFLARLLNKKELFQKSFFEVDNEISVIISS